MSQIAEIERLGAAVERGEISRDTAAQQLREYSEGGLTLLGAGLQLDNWREARADIEGEACRARTALRDLS